MSVFTGSGTGPPGGGLPAPVSGLFALLWDGLADLLGTAATATLLKRAALRATARNPELAGLVIHRQGVAYGYTCPARWDDASPDGAAALRAVILELRPILIEMTGMIVIRHLEQIDELRERGLLAPQEESP